MVLASLIGSKARQAILLHLYLKPDLELYLRELVRLTGFAPRTIQKELDNLVQKDLLIERRSGNRRYLQANTNHPLFKPIQDLLLRSEGFLEVLRDALGEKGIDFALVFGSMADGTAKSASDIDILIVGDIGLRAALKRMSGLPDLLGREVNPVVWTSDEYKRRLAEQDHFLMNILQQPRLEIKGTPDES